MHARICERMRRVNPKRTSRLIQTVVKPAVLKQLDALAKATGHTRASYLRYLIEMHVQSLDPQLARALAWGHPDKGATIP